MAFAAAVKKHTTLISALVMREVTTRFGREGIGFLWVIGEPLMFCVGVLIMWGFIKPEYEHGVRVGPFVMTGYMCLLILRHMVTGSIGAVQANVGLFHHRQVSVNHVMFARNLSEFMGGTLAFVIVYAALIILGECELPWNWMLFYGGWFLNAWVAFGLSYLFAALSVRFEIMERIVPVATYAMIPASGCFTMASLIPDKYREGYLLIPMPHGVEMVRGAVFGEFVHVYYHPWYAFAWGAVLLFSGIVLLSDAKDRVLID